MNNISTNLLSIRKYYKLFTHESNTFLFSNTLKNAIQTIGPEKPPIPPLPLAERGPPSNTPMPELTPLTAPNDSSISSCTFTQLCHKVSIGCNGTPQIHPQIASSDCLISTPSNTPVPQPTSLTTPNRHSDPISVFFTIHPLEGYTHRQTDSLTDGKGDTSVRIPAYTLYTLVTRLIILVCLVVNV